MGSVRSDPRCIGIVQSLYPGKFPFVGERTTRYHLSNVSQRLGTGVVYIYYFVDYKDFVDDARD